MARERKFSTDHLFRATRSLLLRHGYEGFTISLLADQLDVPRGAIYKYYVNKEELLSEFLLYEMNLFLNQLAQIDNTTDFEDQFDFILNLIFGHPDIQRLIEMGKQIPIHTNSIAQNNREMLNQLHLDMYGYLEGFIKLGRQENKLNPHVPDSLILGFIFQSIAIPNHFNVPHSEWVQYIKEILRNGLFTKK